MPRTLKADVPQRIAAVNKYLDVLEMHGKKPESLIAVARACDLPFSTLNSAPSYRSTANRIRRMIGKDMTPVADKLRAVVEKYEADPHNAPLKKVAYAREAGVRDEYVYRYPSLGRRIQALIDSSWL